MDKLDSAVSAYDTEEFKEGLLEQLMEGFGKDTGNGYVFADMDFRNVYYPRLTDVYQMEEDTNFLVLEYWIHRRPGQPRISPPDNIAVHAAYVPSSDKLYLLSDGFGVSLEERFNKIIEENEGIPELSDVCRSVLLVRLKYLFGIVTVIDDSCDAKIWIRVHHSLAPFDLPEKWLQRNAFFSFFPSRAPELLSALWLYDEDACGDRLFYSSQRETYSEAMDSVEIQPLTVSQVGDTTFVELTVYELAASIYLQ